MALTLKAGAADVVVRARDGDQNAMGMIAEVRKQALACNEISRMGFEAIREYIEKNPTAGNRVATEFDCVIGAEGVRVLRDLKSIASTTRSPMGSETNSEQDQRETIMTCLILLKLPKVGGERTLNAGTVALANGPKLTEARIRQIGEGIKDENLRSFF